MTPHSHRFPPSPFYHNLHLLPSARSERRAVFQQQGEPGEPVRTPHPSVGRTPADPAGERPDLLSGRRWQARGGVAERLVRRSRFAILQGGEAARLRGGEQSEGQCRVVIT